MLIMTINELVIIPVLQIFYLFVSVASTSSEEHNPLFRKLRSRHGQDFIRSAARGNHRCGSQNRCWNQRQFRALFFAVGLFTGAAGAEAAQERGFRRKNEVQVFEIRAG